MRAPCLSPSPHRRIASARSFASPSTGRSVSAFAPISHSDTTEIRISSHLLQQASEEAPEPDSQDIAETVEEMEPEVEMNELPADAYTDEEQPLSEPLSP